MEKLEMTYDASPDRIWQLWTTPAGIERWWSPDGFEVTVDELDLVPGGALVYTMTATAAEQVEFLQGAGLPLQTTARKTFTVVEAPSRLGYSSLIDFVPDHAPYEHLTEVTLTPEDGGTRVVMTMERLHDDVWTERLLAGRKNELENLAGALAG